MARELGPEVCAVQRAVKDALDPLDLFNPGKVTGSAPAGPVGPAAPAGE